MPTTIAPLARLKYVFWNRRIAIALCQVLACVVVADMTCSCAQSNPNYAFAPSPSGSSTFVFSTSEREARLASLKTALTDALTSTPRGAGGETEEQWLADGDPTPITRDLANAAFDELAVGRSPKIAAALLKRMFSSQDTETSSPTYGEIPWTINDATIQDPNSDEFANEAIGPILTAYSTKLAQVDPALVKQIKTVNIPASIAVLTGQLATRAKEWPSYTNMTLMLATDLILEAEAIGDKADANQGYALLDSWIAYTKQNGIREYGSPTYYATDLDSLVMGYLYAQDPNGRKEYKEALNCIWFDVAATDFAPRGAIAGAHSRDYDFIDGDGTLNVYLYVEGLRAAEKLSNPPLEETYIYAGLSDPKAYHPSAEITSLALSGERTVEQKCGPGENQERTTYINGDYAIGTCNGDYGPQDKQFNLDLASPDDVDQPDTTIVAQENDDPYGLKKARDKSGHSKPHHLNLNPVFAQNKNAVLALFIIDPAKVPDHGDVSNLSTSILFPSTVATLWYQGRKIEISPTLNVDVAANSATFGFRNRTAGAVFRVFHLDSPLGSSPQITFVSDPDSYRRHVVRLKIAHNLNDDLVTATTAIRVGVLVVAGHFSTDADLAAAVDAVQRTEIVDEGDVDDWHVTVPQIAGSRLEAERSANKVIKRLVNGAPCSQAVFDVNGIDVGQKIWGGSD